MNQAHEQLIGPVPSQLTSKAASRRGPGSHAEFNLAVWLHLPGLAELPASLVVRYLDGGQPREAQVDHGRLNGQGRILLSGVAHLPYRNTPSEVRLYLRSALPLRAPIVEECFIEPVLQESRSLNSVS